MELCGNYRSKSASRGEKRFYQGDLKLNLTSLTAWKLEGKIVNPERDAELSNNLPEKLLNLSKKVNSNTISVNPDRTLTKNRTAIDELQELVTPR